MSTHSLASQSVLIVGLARSGLAAARLARRLGARVLLSDSRGPEAFAGRLDEFEALADRVELGGHRDETLAQSDLIVVSPGVPLSIAPLRRALERGQRVIGEVELALGCIDLPLIAITGTNGKTTSAALCAHLLRAAGRRVFLGGNIGNPLSNLALELLERRGEAPRLAVVELSSFQLESAPSLHARVAVWLNLGDDHLDRYARPEDYAAAKARLFANQTSEDWIVIPADDARIAAHAAKSPARIATFGPGGDLRMEHDRLRCNLPGRDQCEIDITSWRLLGAHNRLNLEAAVGCALLAGADSEALAAGVADFAPLPHRLEPVGEIRGVRFYNDSKATTPDSLIAAVRSFEEPLVLIAGGRGKGADFSVLREAVAERARAVLLIGEAADELQHVLQGVTRLERCDTLEQAVRLGLELAAPDASVLLSPACASFDMFDDYEHRGRSFTAAVRTLAGGEA
ncbi:MAG: UDP-N-acetylmuramoyl-L-alanine--D-glutamate ligase [Candidatus Alcyoniella australis]|nr:UDP-N-acetylmuramoyl-L-alanine--D-glutamate ligase [Candidatus Alcyoniella australis]